MSGCVSAWASEWLAGEQAIEGVGKSEWSGWLGKGEWHRQFFSFGQVDWSTDGHVVETKVVFFSWQHRLHGGRRQQVYVTTQLARGPHCLQDSIGRLIFVERLRVYVCAWDRSVQDGSGCTYSSGTRERETRETRDDNRQTYIHT